jgi:hypothetical protein
MRGTTLIELVTALAIMTVVAGSLYLLLGAGIKGRLIVHARVSDQERGRLALMWLSDHVRQINYDARSACPEGLLRIGSGAGFGQRLAFRAIIDEALAPPRRIYVYYVDNETLWQEVQTEAAGAQCFQEMSRAGPDRARTALTPRIVRALELRFFDRNGEITGTPSLVRSIGITLRLDAESTRGTIESQTYHTVVTVRGI